MGCGMSMVKYILFLFNLLCAICGILIISFGALLFSNIHSAKDLADAFKQQQVPVALIVLGSIILIIAFFGCCGAIRESYCMSMTYSILLFILLVLQVALIVYAFIAKDDFLKEVGKIVDTAWEQSTSEKKTTYMDGIQATYKCCGKNSFADYGLAGLLPPASCCDLNESTCTVFNAHKVGCKRAFVDWWDKNWDIIKYAGIGIAVIEIAGILIIVFSSIMIAETKATYNIEEAEATRGLGIALLVLGAAITIVAFFGCCGAIKESACMSITYIAFLVILLLFQIAVIVIIAIGKKPFLDLMEEVVVQGFNKRSEHPEVMDSIQKSIHCCGVDGYSDYKLFEFAHPGVYPDSCCDEKLKEENKDFQCSIKDVFKIGCKTEFSKNWASMWNAMLWGAVIVGAIELAGIISACCLVVNIRNEKRRSAY